MNIIFLITGFLLSDGHLETVQLESRAFDSCKSIHVFRTFAPAHDLAQVPLAHALDSFHSLNFMPVPTSYKKSLTGERSESAR